MHLIGHALSAVPFALCGAWGVAAGALAPDLTWVANEVRFRRSAEPMWSRWIAQVPEDAIRPYRFAHGVALPVVLLVAGVFLAPLLRDFAIGWLIHIALDLPTHRGRMRQQPFYPFSDWRWPWTL